MNKRRVLLVPSSGDLKPVNDITDSILEKRLQKALELWKNGSYDYMVLSGGIVSPKNIQTEPHAVIMWNWLQNQEGGPSLEQIIFEPCSHDSYENAEYTSTLLAARSLTAGNAELTIVTDQWHGRRLSHTLEYGYGWHNVQVIAPDYQLSLVGRLVEHVLLLVHLIDPLGKGPLAGINRSIRTQS